MVSESDIYATSGTRSLIKIPKCALCKVTPTKGVNNVSKQSIYHIKYICPIVYANEC